jgi:hypothetical protein
LSNSKNENSDKSMKFEVSPNCLSANEIEDLNWIILTKADMKEPQYERALHVLDCPDCAELLSTILGAHETMRHESIQQRINEYLNRIDSLISRSASISIRRTNHGVIISQLAGLSLSEKDLKHPGSKDLLPLARSGDIDLQHLTGDDSLYEVQIRENGKRLQLEFSPTINVAVEINQNKIDALEHNEFSVDLSADSLLDIKIILEERREVELSITCEDVDVITNPVELLSFYVDLLVNGRFNLLSNLREQITQVVSNQADLWNKALDTIMLTFLPVPLHREEKHELDSEVWHDLIKGLQLIAPLNEMSKRPVLAPYKIELSELEKNLGNGMAAESASVISDVIKSTEQSLDAEDNANLHTLHGWLLFCLGKHKDAKIAFDTAEKIAKDTAEKLAQRSSPLNYYITLGKMSCERLERYPSTSLKNAVLHSLIECVI